MREHPNASLRVENGLEDSSTINLDTANVVLGSSPSADKTLENKFVSRRHFQIRNHDAVYYITDLDSTNGTYLNGERLLPNVERRVKDGDRINLANDEVELRFVDPASTVRIDPNSLITGRIPDFENLVVELASREVWVRGQKQEPPLARKEFDIIEILYRNKGNAVSRGEIAAAGWPERDDGAVSDEEIDQYIRRLRRRVEIDPSKPKLIVTLRGYGYRMP